MSLRLRERVYGGHLERFAWLQNGRGTTLLAHLVDRVRELLALKAEGAVPVVDSPALAGGFAVEEVAGVELDAGFSGADGHRPARLRFANDRRGHQAFGLRVVDHVVQIVPLGV